MLKNVAGVLENFFFGLRDLKTVALYRTIFACILLVMYVIRALELKLFYFNEGLMPSGSAPLFLPEYYKPLLYWFPNTNTMVVVFLVLHLLSLILLALGVLGQFSTWIVWFFHLAFIQRNYTVMYGADIISTFLLFYLGFVRHNLYFSVYNYFCKTRKSNSDWQADLSSLGIRFIQIQLCVTYTYTGLEKMKGMSWWEGSAVWKVVANSQLAPFDMSYLSQVPVLVAILSYLTVVFEVYFILAVCTKKLRFPWLVLGGAFHLCAAFTMGLHFFSGVMVAAYLVFFRWDEIKLLHTRVKQLF